MSPSAGHYINEAEQQRRDGHTEAAALSAQLALAHGVAELAKAAELAKVFRRAEPELPAAGSPSLLHAATVLVEYGLPGATADAHDVAVGRLILHHQVPWGNAEAVARRACALCPRPELDEVMICVDRLGLADL